MLKNLPNLRKTKCGKFSVKSVDVSKLGKMKSSIIGSAALLYSTCTRIRCTNENGLREEIIYVNRW